jgi:hypothetical protein
MSCEIANFDDIKISTQTIIGISNLTINTEKLFHKFQIVPYKIIEKRRGRKKKTEVEQIPEILDDGSIITVKFGDTIRGVDTKQYKKQGKYFRNALTIVMFMDKKLINFKISKNGKFQFTGCKDINHAIKCIQYMWRQINTESYKIDVKIDDNHSLYEFQDNTNQFTIRFLTVMANIDFNIGFPINREKLDIFINSNTIYNSLLETSFGYTGVNIKIKVADDINFYINCMTYDDKNNNWDLSKILYSDFVNLHIDYQKYKHKFRYNTFLVFHSGNIIMSGFNPEYMRNCYQHFRRLLVENRKHIEEIIQI